MCVTSGKKALIPFCCSSAATFFSCFDLVCKAYQEVLSTRAAGIFSTICKVPIASPSKSHCFVAPKVQNYLVNEELYYVFQLALHLSVPAIVTSVPHGGTAVL